MPSVFSANKTFEQQATGENDNTWGTKLNTVIGQIDESFGKSTVSVAGSSNVTLTTAQARSLVQEFTGTLTGDIAVIVPTAEAVYLVHNNTDGDFALEVKTVAGTGVDIPQGQKVIVYADGTNVVSGINTGLISGALTLNSIISPAEITANQDDYNPTGLSSASVLRLSSDAARSITGIEAQENGHVGKLINVGSFPITLENQDSGSSEANRFALGVDVPLQPGHAIEIIYDATSSRWRATAGWVNGVPIGAGMDYWGTTAPAGYAFPVGQNISRTTYALAFAVLGTQYGAGDGSTTFGLPDKRGRGSFTKDDMGGSAASRITSGGSGITGTTLGAAGGSQLMQQHSHGVTDPTHTHTSFLNMVAFSGGGNTLPTGGTNAGTTSFLNAAATGISIQNAGSGGSQNMPPAIICNYIIFLGA